MIAIPKDVFLVLVLMFPVYFFSIRMWDTFDNWLKAKTLNKNRNPIGFNKEEK